MSYSVYEHLAVPVAAQDEIDRLLRTPQVEQTNVVTGRPPGGKLDTGIVTRTIHRVEFRFVLSDCGAMPPLSYSNYAAGNKCNAVAMRLPASARDFKRTGSRCRGQTLVCTLGGNEK